MATATKVLHTDTTAFSKLEDWPYPVHFLPIPVEDLSQKHGRLAYYDIRTEDWSADSSELFLCMHGVPTWSYLYRRMIPVLLGSNTHHKRGVRIILVDFIGWGQSDKPESTEFHSVSFHRDSIV